MEQYVHLLVSGFVYLPKRKCRLRKYFRMDVVNMLIDQTGRKRRRGGHKIRHRPFEKKLGEKGGINVSLNAGEFFIFVCWQSGPIKGRWEGAHLRRLIKSRQMRRCWIALCYLRRLLNVAARRLRPGRPRRPLTWPPTVAFDGQKPRARWNR